MRRKKKRRRDFEALATVLGRDQAFHEVVTGYGAPVSARDWETAVGSRIAARARPTRLDRGMLIVTAATAAWSNELSLLSEPIIANLKKLGLDVKELRFRVGAIDPPMRPRRPPKTAPAPARLEAPLTRTLERVEDDALRAAIEAAARRSLGFGKDD